MKLGSYLLVLLLLLFKGTKELTEIVSLIIDLLGLFFFKSWVMVLFNLQDF
jgi:hypothetical protein